MKKWPRITATLNLLLVLGVVVVWWWLSLTPVSSELECLAKNIYWEAAAAGEPDEGLRIVGHVTEVRRKANRRYWGGNTYCGVVYARSVKKHPKRPNSPRTVCQFSWTCLSVASQVPRNRAKWARSLEIAKEQKEGKYTPPQEFSAATFYLRPAHSARKNVCAFNKTLVRIGPIVGTSKHIVYREPLTVEERNELAQRRPIECQPLKPPAKKKDGKKKEEKKK